MTVWVFALGTLSAALFAVFERNIRRATLAVWLAGLGAGAIAMTLGAETLAIVQWVVSTLVALSFLFFVAMLGEDGETRGRPMSRREIGMLAGSILIGAGFVGMIAFGTYHLGLTVDMNAVHGADLQGLGKALTGPHVLSLEIVGLTLLFVLIGGGIIARPEKPDAGDSEPEGATRP